MTNRRVDAWGRVVYTPEAAFELLLGGHEIGPLLIEDGDDLRRYNGVCRTFDKGEHALTAAHDPDISPEEEHARRSATWHIPDEYQGVDVRSLLLEICDTEEQRARVNEEMDLYEARGLVPMLRAMISLVAHFRENGVVWGVGRGSSVASYVLYLIGITRIDPMRYGLKITDYLR